LEELLVDIKLALDGELPGSASHDQMMRAKRPTAEESMSGGLNPRLSAVLMLIYPREDTLYTPLILRPSYEGVHSAQVSFPGGKKEDEDHSLHDTALRETEEEIGVDRQSVEIIGSLTPLYIPPSNFHVNPFVGLLDRAPELIPDPKEVDQVLEVPVHQLLEQPVLDKDIYLEKYKATFPISYFDVHGHTVWGATAMILAEFRDMMSKS
jgi:8-oxo-dGTP pyrophosphatase MutT (NUDIX family)